MVHRSKRRHYFQVVQTLNHRNLQFRPNSYNLNILDRLKLTPPCSIVSPLLCSFHLHRGECGDLKCTNIHGAAGLLELCTRLVALMQQHVFPPHYRGWNHRIMDHGSRIMLSADTHTYTQHSRHAGSAQVQAYKKEIKFALRCAIFTKCSRWLIFITDSVTSLLFAEEKCKLQCEAKRCYFFLSLFRSCCSFV